MNNSDIHQNELESRFEKELVEFLKKHSERLNTGDHRFLWDVALALTIIELGYLFFCEYRRKNEKEKNNE